MTAQPEPAARAADFDEFYAATAKRMVAVVYAVTGDLNEAEDAVQEAYARAWQRWAKLIEEGDPGPWVRAVALRLAVSTWRKTRSRILAHFRHGPPSDTPDLAPDRVALVAALRTLGGDQRTAVVMHHLLDLPVEEIARETGVSTAVVRSRLSRGRKALGAQLKDERESGGPPRPRSPADRPAAIRPSAAADRSAATRRTAATDRCTNADRPGDTAYRRTEEVPLHG
jgi:RNA polymerase sigma-70 factor (ECF subfamily)